jgi:hypothetical protein
VQEPVDVGVARERQNPIGVSFTGSISRTAQERGMRVVADRRIEQVAFSIQGSRASAVIIMSPGYEVRPVESMRRTSC